VVVVGFEEVSRDLLEAAALFRGEESPPDTDLLRVRALAALSLLLAPVVLGDVVPDRGEPTMNGAGSSREARQLRRRGSRRMMRLPCRLRGE
jgi:hypothetical protein